MAQAFNLTAQLNLQSPNNVNQVVNDIRRQLRPIGVEVKIQNARNLATANRDLNQFSRNATNANKSMSNLNRTLQESARRFSVITIATGSFLALANSFKKSVSNAVAFERELVKISQVTGKTVAQLGSLADEVTRLSTSLGASSSDLLSVARTLTQAGFAADDTRRALEVLAQTSLGATFDNIQDTTEGAIALLRQFSNEAAATGGDIAFLERSLSAISAVSKNFAVESGDLVTAIRRTGGVFAAAGGEINELIALFTSVRATTRESAETIATGLRTIFTRIQRPETIDQLKAFGIQLQDSQGNFVGAFEAFKRLSQGLKGLDARSSAFSQIVEDLGGFRQVGKVIPLIQQFTTSTQALAVAQGASGTVAKDAETAQQSLGVQVDKVRQQFDALIRKFADSSSFRSVAGFAIKLAESFIKVADALEPLLPLLTSLLGLKLGQGLAPAVAGLAGIGKRAGGTGPVTKFASGGMVPGTGNRDTVPAMLTPGEFVIRKASVKKLGAGNLAAMNNNRYSHGGKPKAKEKQVPAGGGTVFAHINEISNRRQQGIKKIASNIGGREIEKAYTNMGLDLPRSWNSDWNSLTKNMHGVFRGNLANYIRGNDVFKTLKGEMSQKIYKLSDDPGQNKKLKESLAKNASSIQQTLAQSISNNTKEFYDIDPEVYASDLGSKLISAVNQHAPELNKALSRVSAIKTKGRSRSSLSGIVSGGLSGDNSEIASDFSNRVARGSRNFFGGLVQKFAAGGIIGKKAAGAAILDPEAASSKQVNITGEDIKKEFTEFKSLPKGKDPISKYYKSSSFNIAKSGLNKETSNKFKMALEDGLVAGINSSTSALANDLGATSAKIDQSQTSNFVKSINTSIFGRLFESAMDSISRGGQYATPDTDPDRPFDAPGGLPPSLKDNFSGLPDSFIDYKASLDAASDANMKGKVIAQIKRELIQDGILNEKYARKDFRDKERASSQAKAEKQRRANEDAGLGFPVKRATGGPAPSDNIPALLTPGEFVMSKSSAQSIGYTNLNRMNKHGVQGYAKGGIVGVRRYDTGTGPLGATGSTTVNFKGSDDIGPDFENVEAATFRVSDALLALGLSVEERVPIIDDFLERLEEGGKYSQALAETLGEFDIKATKAGESITLLSDVINEAAARSQESSPTKTTSPAVDSSDGYYSLEPQGGDFSRGVFNSSNEAISSAEAAVDSQLQQQAAEATNRQTEASNRSAEASQKAAEASEKAAEASEKAAEADEEQANTSKKSSKSSPVSSGLMRAEQIASSVNSVAGAAQQFVFLGSSVAAVASQFSSASETTKTAISRTAGELTGLVGIIGTVTQIFSSLAVAAVQRKIADQQEAAQKASKIAQDKISEQSERSNTNAVNQDTVAEVRNTRATNANTASRSVNGTSGGIGGIVGGTGAKSAASSAGKLSKLGGAAAKLGAGLLTLVGGPVGLAIAAFTALAAYVSYSRNKVQAEYEKLANSARDLANQFNETGEGLAQYKAAMIALAQVGLQYERAKLEGGGADFEGFLGTMKNLMSGVMGLIGRKDYDPTNMNSLLGMLKDAKGTFMEPVLDTAIKGSSAAQKRGVTDVDSAIVFLEKEIDKATDAVENFPKEIADLIDGFNELKSEIKAQNDAYQLITNSVFDAATKFQKFSSILEENLSINRGVLEEQKPGSDITTTDEYKELVGKFSTIEDFQRALADPQSVEDENKKLIPSLVKLKIRTDELAQAQKFAAENVAKATSLFNDSLGRAKNSSDIGNLSKFLSPTLEQGENFQGPPERGLGQTKATANTDVEKAFKMLSNAMRQEAEFRILQLRIQRGQLTDKNDQDGELRKSIDEQIDSSRRATNANIEANKQYAEEVGRLADIRSETDRINKLNQSFDDLNNSVKKSIEIFLSTQELMNQTYGADNNSFGAVLERNFLRMRQELSERNTAASKLSAVQLDTGLVGDVAGLQAERDRIKSAEGGSQEEIAARERQITAIDGELERISKQESLQNALNGAMKDNISLIEKERAARSQMTQVLEEFVVGGKEAREQLRNAARGIQDAVSTGTLQNQSEEERKSTISLLDKLSDVAITSDRFTGQALTGEDVKKRLIFDDAVRLGLDPAIASQIANATSTEKQLIRANELLRFQMMALTNTMQMATAVIAANQANDANGFSAGGMVQYRAGGGSIFKPRGTDTVPAMLSPGEFVLQKSAVDQIGVGTLQAINDGAGVVPAFAKGGPVYLSGGSLSPIEKAQVAAGKLDTNQESYMQSMINALSGDPYASDNKISKYTRRRDNAIKSEKDASTFAGIEAAQGSVRDNPLSFIPVGSTASFLMDASMGVGKNIAAGGGYEAENRENLVSGAFALGGGRALSSATGAISRGIPVGTGLKAAEDEAAYMVGSTGKLAADQVLDYEKSSTSMDVLQLGGMMVSDFFGGKEKRAKEKDILSEALNDEKARNEAARKEQLRIEYNRNLAPGPGMSEEEKASALSAAEGAAFDRTISRVNSETINQDAQRALEQHRKRVEERESKKKSATPETFSRAPVRSNVIGKYSLDFLNKKEKKLGEGGNYRIPDKLPPKIGSKGVQSLEEFNYSQGETSPAFEAVPDESLPLSPRDKEFMLGRPTADGSEVPLPGSGAGKGLLPTRFPTRAGLTEAEEAAAFDSAIARINSETAAQDLARTANADRQEGAAFDSAIARINSETGVQDIARAANADRQEAALFDSAIARINSETGAQDLARTANADRQEAAAFDSAIARINSETDAQDLVRAANAATTTAPDVGIASSSDLSLPSSQPPKQIKAKEEQETSARYRRTGYTARRRERLTGKKTYTYPGAREYTDSEGNTRYAAVTRSEGPARNKAEVSTSQRVAEFNAQKYGNRFGYGRSGGNNQGTQGAASFTLKKGNAPSIQQAKGGNPSSGANEMSMMMMLMMQQQMMMQRQMMGGGRSALGGAFVNSLAGRGNRRNSNNMIRYGTIPGSPYNSMLGRGGYNLPMVNKNMYLAGGAAFFARGGPVNYLDDGGFPSISTAPSELSLEDLLLEKEIAEQMLGSSLESFQDLRNVDTQISNTMLDNMAAERQARIDAGREKYRKDLESQLSKDYMDKYVDPSRTASHEIAVADRLLEMSDPESMKKAGLTDEFFSTYMSREDREKRDQPLVDARIAASPDWDAMSRFGKVGIMREQTDDYGGISNPAVTLNPNRLNKDGSNKRRSVDTPFGPVDAGLEDLLVRRSASTHKQEVLKEAENDPFFRMEWRDATAGGGGAFVETFSGSKKTQSQLDREKKDAQMGIKIADMMKNDPRIKTETNIRRRDFDGGKITEKQYEFEGEPISEKALRRRLENEIRQKERGGRVGPPREADSENAKRANAAQSAKDKRQQELEALSGGTGIIFGSQAAKDAYYRKQELKDQLRSGEITSKEYQDQISSMKNSTSVDTGAAAQTPASSRGVEEAQAQAQVQAQESVETNRSLLAGIQAYEADNGVQQRVTPPLLNYLNNNGYTFQDAAEVESFVLSRWNEMQERARQEARNTGTISSSNAERAAAVDGMSGPQASAPQVDGMSGPQVSAPQQQMRLAEDDKDGSYRQIATKKEEQKTQTKYERTGYTSRRRERLTGAKTFTYPGAREYTDSEGNTRYAAVTRSESPTRNRAEFSASERIKQFNAQKYGNKFGYGKSGGSNYRGQSATQSQMSPQMQMMMQMMMMNQAALGGGFVNSLAGRGNRNSNMVPFGYIPGSPYNSMLGNGGYNIPMFDKRMLFGNGAAFFADGGAAAGGDTVPAMLTPGEFVMNNDAVKKYGTSFMQKLNRGEVQGFNRGGPVQYRQGGGGIFGSLSSAVSGAASSLGIDTSGIQNTFDSFVANFSSVFDNISSAFSGLERVAQIFAKGFDMSHQVDVGGQINIAGINVEAIKDELSGFIGKYVADEVSKKMDEQNNKFQSGG